MQRRQHCRRNECCILQHQQLCRRNERLRSSQENVPHEMSVAKYKMNHAPSRCERSDSLRDGAPDDMVDRFPCGTALCHDLVVCIPCGTVLRHDLVVCIPCGMALRHDVAVCFPCGMVQQPELNDGEETAGDKIGDDDNPFPIVVPAVEISYTESVMRGDVVKGRQQLVRST